ncbi:hypothetical protein N7540_007930 [Penicillium herquei]|nr:hypothetical protein N7540_007930 [Penicillium herquei]
MRTRVNLTAGLRSSALVPASGRNLSANISGGARRESMSLQSGLLRTLTRGTPHTEAVRSRVIHRCRLGSLDQINSFSTTPASHIRLEVEVEEHEEHKPQKNTRPVVRPTRRPPLPAAPSSMNMKTLIMSRTPKPKPPKRRKPGEPVLPWELTDPQLSPEEFIRKIEQETCEIREAARDIEAKFERLPKLSYSLQDILDSAYKNLETHLKGIIATSWEISADIQSISNDRLDRIQNLIDCSQAVCWQIEHEYCKVVYRRTPMWTTTVSEIENNVLHLHYKFIRLRFKSSQIETSLVKNVLNRDYFKPRRSARAKVDNLLAETDKHTKMYSDLQAKGQSVSVGSSDVIQSLTGLQYLDRQIRSEPGRRFEDFQLRLEQSRQRLGWTAHDYRSAWKERSVAEGSFKDAHFWSPKDFSNVTRSGKIYDVTPLEVARYLMLGPLLNRKQEKALLIRRQMIRKHLMDVYFSRPTRGTRPTNSAELDVAWRQLDVMAPFETKLVLDWWLQEEILLLIKAVEGPLCAFGPLFPDANPETLRHVKHSLKDLYAKYTESRNAFSFELSEYKNINWLRLQIEKKLYQLGEPSDIQERGLFVAPHPLSQSRPRFNHWVKMISHVSFKAWVARRLNLIPYEATVTESGEMSTPYNEMSKSYIWLRMESFVSEIESAPRSKSRRKRMREILPTAIEVKRPLLPVFTRKFGIKEASSDETTPSEKMPENASAETNKSLETQPNAPLEKRTQEELRVLEIQRMLLARPSKALRRSKLKNKLSKGRLRWPFQQKPRPQRSTKLQQRRRRGKSSITTNSSKSSSEPFPWQEFAATSRMKKNSSTPFKPFPWREFAAAARRKREARLAASKMGSGAIQRPVVPGFTSKPEPGQPSGSRPYSTFSNAVQTLNHDESQKYASEKALPLRVRPAGEVAIEIRPKVQDSTTPLFWRHSAQRAPSGEKLIVHYCRSLENTEEVAQLFLDSKVIGFDMEWKAQATAREGIRNNVSLIQIANEERIALFQISLFRPATTPQEFIAPSLKKILESPDITKVGVAIKGDTTRLRKFLGIDTKSIFELSHLYRLVKYGLTDPRLVHKRLVRLSDQVEEHLGLPLEKIDDVRCGDWTRPLNYQQTFTNRVIDAATDPYACICLFNIMEEKRLAMDPMPPRPAHAELNLPIVLPHGEPATTEDATLLASELVVPESADDVDNDKP